MNKHDTKNEECKASCDSECNQDHTHFDENDCTCPSTIFEGENSSLKKTFEEAVRHDPENKECHWITTCESEEYCGNRCYTCPPAQKEEWGDEFDKTFRIEGKISYPNYELIKDFIRSQISLAEARGREEANKCDECGGTDVVCAKGVMDSIRLARTETINAFEEWAKKYRIFTSTCGHTGDEEKGYQKGLTAGESLFQASLLSFASFLKSNAPKV